jgi:hypothetical protein
VQNAALRTSPEYPPTGPPEVRPIVGSCGPKLQPAALRGPLDGVADLRIDMRMAAPAVV